MIVPPLLVTHALMFRMLLWPIDKGAVGERKVQREA
jgi:hypothetical protein